MKKASLIISCLILFLIFVSCNKKENNVQEKTSAGEFSWKSEIKISDIPDFPVKGVINGKEIKIDYVNFEQWRGSGDNVLNFGDVIPKNRCGFVEGGNSFHLLHKSGELKIGELLKATFEQNLDGYIAYYDTIKTAEHELKSAAGWNCALFITDSDEKSVKGKIAICFKDDRKSWIAGNFVAIKCLN